MPKGQKMHVAISVATPDDVLGIQEVFIQGWVATYPNAEHGITVDDIKEWFTDRDLRGNLQKRKERLANPVNGQTTLVAKAGGRVVGVCRVMKHSDRNHLESIYVLPEYHGRGIGTAMWNSAQQYLDSTKHTIVEVATYNDKAIQFYGGLGFVDTGMRILDPRFTMKSGAVIPEMEMRREVA